jgi:hypothetical protein
MSNKKVYGLYIPMLKTIHLQNKTIKKYLSEDWSFCERWRDLGGQIFADTSIVLKHYGEKPHTLWDTEVVVQRRVPSEKQEVNPEPEPKIGVPKVGHNLPEPGFDLEGE